MAGPDRASARPHGNPAPLPKLHRRRHRRTGHWRRTRAAAEARHSAVACACRGDAMATRTSSPLTAAHLKVTDAYWRAANYLSVGQIYLLDNPLLRVPLTR